MSDTKYFLGIDVGADSLKLALWDHVEKRILKTAVLGTETSPIEDIYTFEGVLQAWFESNALEQGVEVAVALPAFKSIVRQVYVPPEACSHIGDYLQWYLCSITNGGKDAYVMDHKILSGDDSLGKTVLLIAVRREWADSLRKGFRSKVLAPKSLEVDVLSLMNLMDFADKIKDMECVVKADYSGVTIIWMNKDNLLSLRCVSTLSLVNKTPDEAYRLLADGIVEQMRLEEESSSFDLKKIRLCGEMAVDENFVNVLGRKLKGCEIIVMNSFSNLQLPEEEESLKDVPVCAAAIGAALSYAEGV